MFGKLCGIRRQADSTFYRPLPAAAILLLGCSVVAADAALIRFRSSASVTSSVVRLGDVAEVLDTDADRAWKLEGIVLAPAPASGGRLKLDFATIRSRLQVHGINLGELEFSGNSMVTVSGATRKKEPVAEKQPPPRPVEPQPLERVSRRQQEQAEKLVEQAVRQYVHRQAPELGSVAVSARLEEADVPLILSAGVSDDELQGGSAPWDEPQTLTFRIRDRDDQDTVHEIRVPCRIDPYPHVLAVKSTLARGHVLEKSDLVLRQVEHAEGALIRVEDAVGRETKRTLHKDETLHADDIRQVPLVRVNDIVTVYSRGPGISVKRQLKARTEGAIGDTVTLVTLDGRTKVLAHVTGYHEAEVIASGTAATNGRSQSNDRIQFVSGRSPGRN